MPIAPTYGSDKTLLGRSTPLPFADGADFGAQTGIAIRNLGSEIQNSATVTGAIIKQHQQLEADKWVNDAMSQLRDYYSRWTADPENNTREDYADRLRANSIVTLNEWTAKAPSKEAKDRFTEQFQRFSNSHMAAAEITTARTRVDNLISSSESQNQSVTQSYETNRMVPNLDANKELVSNIKDRFTQIDRTFGQIAPAKAQDLKNQLVEDATYASMKYSPDTARQVLNMGTLSGRQKHALESQIKAAEESINSVDLAALNNLVQNTVAQAELGKHPANLDISTFNLYLPDDKANALWRHANDLIDTYNQAYDHIDKIQSWSGPAQVEYVDSLAQSAGQNPATADRDKTVLSFVSKKVADNVRQFQRDPAGYLLENNPAIKGVDDHIRSLYALDPQSPALKQKYAERDALMLQFQGLPPAGVTGDARKQYNVVNRSQLKVMSDAEAQAAVQRINQSSPNEALNTIISEVSRHPGNEAIAFNNMVQLQTGQGIRGDYWLVYNNWKNPAAADLTGALQNSTAARELAADKMADFDKALDGYAPWRAFTQIFPSDNYQMEGMAAGIRSGVVSYALMQAQTQKVSPELAIKKSVDTWIYGEMAMMPVNGQGTMIQRDQNGKPPLTDSEAAQMGKNLELALWYIDPTQVWTKDQFGRELFPVLGSIGNDKTKEEQLRQLILSRGFFKPSSDGKSATLYMRNDTGTPFEVRDTNHRAFMIALDQLPDLHKRISTFMNPRGIQIPKEADPLAPVIHLKGDVIGTTGHLGKYGFEFDTYTQSTTNWPVDPKWLQRR